jgi:hypothetical protein
LRDACSAQFRALFQGCHRKSLILGSQGPGTGHRAMTIGVGLDHRQQGPSMKTSRAAKVFAQTFQIDMNGGRT